jgi:hypothetical protein
MSETGTPSLTESFTTAADAAAAEIWALYDAEFDKDPTVADKAESFLLLAQAAAITAAFGAGASLTNAIEIGNTAGHLSEDQ